jgi:hypothetical protein
MDASVHFDHFQRAVQRELWPLVGFVPGSDPSVPYADLRIGPAAAAGEPSTGFDLRQISGTTNRD